MQLTGSGAEALASFFTAPISGFYAVEFDFSVDSVTGTGKLGVLLSSAGLLGTSSVAEAGNNANAKNAMILFMPAGAVLQTGVEKPGTISNSPDWTLTVRVRSVGGPDLLQET